MSVDLSVVTLKGQKLSNLTVSFNSTVRQVKHAISAKMHGQQVII